MKCNNCNSEKHRRKHLAECAKTGLMLDIVQCECGLVFQNPQLPAEYGEKYFNDAYAGRTDNPYFNDAAMNVLRNVNRADLLPIQNARILDFGCGDGLFMHIAKQWNHQCVGVEKSIEAKNRAKWRGKVYDSIPDGEFDIITLWDVIEHLPDPKQTIAELAEHLKPGGIFIIETADINSYDYFLKRRNWSFFIMDHYYYYSEQTLEALFEGYKSIYLKQKPAKGSIIKRTITSALNLSDHAIMIKGFIKQS